MFYAKTFAKHYSRIKHGLKIDNGYIKIKKKRFTAADFQRIGHGCKNFIKNVLIYL